MEDNGSKVEHKISLCILCFEYIKEIAKSKASEDDCKEFIEKYYELSIKA
jgi:hypothetical protein